MLRIAAAALVWMLAVSGAAAQPAAPDTAPTPPTVQPEVQSTEPDSVPYDCSGFDPKTLAQGTLTKPQRDAVKECLEIRHLADQFTREPWDFSRMTPQEATLAAGLLALLAATIGYLIKAGVDLGSEYVRIRVERRNMVESRIQDWQNDLAGSEHMAQRLAVVGLVRMAKAMGGTKRLLHNGSTDASLIVALLLAWLIEHTDEKAPTKYAADEMRKLFKAARRIPKDVRDIGSGPLRLKDYNVQNTRIYDAFWAGIDARGVDFFNATLSKTSFRSARLDRAVFYKATLEETVFKNASLVGANFQEANISDANFIGADLTGVINLATATFKTSPKWSASTKWPEGFDPAANGYGPAST